MSAQTEVENRMPKRIQRRRTKGWRMPEGAIYVGRPTTWGNPFTTDSADLSTILELFESYCIGFLKNVPDWLEPLRGKDLACWCGLCAEHKDGKPLGVQCENCAPCHVDPLLKLANAPKRLAHQPDPQTQGWMI